MNNFKSGSGNLDFGGSDDDTEESTEEGQPEEPELEDTAPPESDTSTPSIDSTSELQDPDQNRHQYPYFVRRSNVTDERDSRIELHLRENVADAEAPFRNELAEALGTDEIAKTDAREFALLFAYENPEEVAELMCDEGYGVID